MSANHTTTLLYDQLTSRLKDHRGLSDLLGGVRLGSLPKFVRGAKSGFIGYILVRLLRSSNKPLFVVVPNESEINGVLTDLRLFGIHGVVFPSWGTGAYSQPSLTSATWGLRMRALVTLHHGTPDVVVAPLRAISATGPDPAAIQGSIFRLNVGDTFDPLEISQRLSSMGYWRVPRVTVHGEYAVRGEVLDIFLPGFDEACRIVFDFDTISEIRYFDVDTQSSTAKAHMVELYPLREVVWNADSLDELRGTAGSWPELRHTGEELERFRLEDEASLPAPYWASAMKGNVSILDHLAPSTRIVWLDRQRLLAASESYRKEHESVFAAEHFRRALPRPDRLFVGVEELISRSEERSVIFESLVDSLTPGLSDSGVIRRDPFSEMYRF